MADIETTIADQGSRPMPEFVKKGLIRVNGGQLYLKAPYRVLWMRDEHPDWSIVTSIEYADYTAGFAVVRAVIMDGEGRVLATAHSEESRGKLPYLKKAETGSIARALALCGYGTQFGEMEEEDASIPGGIADSPVGAATGRGSLGPGEPGMTAGTVNQGPGACPSCKAPEGKKHATNCRG